MHTTHFINVNQAEIVYFVCFMELTLNNFFSKLYTKFHFQRRISLSGTNGMKCVIQSTECVEMNGSRAIFLMDFCPLYVQLVINSIMFTDKIISRPKIVPIIKFNCSV